MEELLTKILEGERQIFSLLRDLINTQQSGKLGFTSDKFIYIGGESGWYFYNGEQSPIPETSLCFKLSKIYTKEKAFKNKTNHKIRLVCDCGENQYTIESGVETYFSRALILSLLTAIRQLKITNKTILKLSIQKGDENVVFPHLYVNGVHVKIDDCKDVNALELLTYQEFKQFI